MLDPEDVISLQDQICQNTGSSYPEVISFRATLAGRLPGRKVEDLTPKTKLLSYYEHDCEGLFGSVQKEQQEAASRSGPREPAQALRAEFEGSLGKLCRSWRGSVQTDEVIDDGVQAVRADGRGDRDCGRKQMN